MRNVLTCNNRSWPTITNSSPPAHIMARVTRSSAASAKLESLDARENETLASSKSRKRQSDARDASPAKRQATAPKQTGNAPKTKPISKDKPGTALEEKPPKASKATNKKEAVPRKSEADLRALRDGPVPDHNPAVAARDPPDQVLYWCMKSEPEIRYEDGYEIKFSIDDLAAKKTPEGWDGTRFLLVLLTRRTYMLTLCPGIRSYMARNNLRQMKKGDKAFFYHSNCKEPGVIGIVNITNEWSRDCTTVSCELTLAASTCSLTVLRERLHQRQPVLRLQRAARRQQVESRPRQAGAQVPRHRPAQDAQGESG